MANTVEIIIKAIDQASGNINKATSGLDKFKAGFQSLTGVSLSAAGGIAAAATAMNKIIDFTKKAVNETVAYVSSIKDMSRLLGMSTEDTSRLVQASDDLFISQDKLKTALLAASRQGVDVSIEGLKELSEKYLSLPAGIERAQMLLKTFGRSGADMGKLMEIGADGIDSAMASIQNSLVVTKSSVINIENYKRSVDNLSDSWTGFTMVVGNAVIPQLDLLFRTFSKGTDNVEDFYHKTNIIQNKISKLAALAAIGNKPAQEEIAKLREELKLLEDAFYNAESGAGGLGDAVADLTPEFYSMSSAMSQVGLASGSIRKEFTTLNDINPTFGDSIAGELNKIKFASSGGTVFQAMHDQIIQGFNNDKFGADITTTLLEQVQIANVALALRTGEIGAYTAKQTIMETLGMTWDEATAELGTWSKDFEGQKIILDAAINLQKFSLSGGTGYGEGGGYYSPGTWKQEAEDALKITLDTTEAYGKIGTLQAAINEIKDKNVTITVNTEIVGAGIGALELASIPPQDLNGNNIIGRAGGGPIWGGTPYVVGEKGPEVIIPGQNGTVIPNNKLGGMGSNVTFYGDAYFALDREITAQDIMKQMRVEV